MSIEQQHPSTDFNEPWRERRACKDAEPGLFFPPQDLTQGVLRQIKIAKSICGRCPVQPLCLNTALQNSQEFGIWGGATPDERVELARYG